MAWLKPWGQGAGWGRSLWNRDGKEGLGGAQVSLLLSEEERERGWRLGSLGWSPGPAADDSAEHSYRCPRPSPNWVTGLVPALPSTCFPASPLQAFPPAPGLLGGSGCACGHTPSVVDLLEDRQEVEQKGLGFEISDVPFQIPAVWAGKTNLFQLQFPHLNEGTLICGVSCWYYHRQTPGTLGRASALAEGQGQETGPEKGVLPRAFACSR